MFCYLHISISTLHPWLPDNDFCCLCRPAEHPHIPHELTGVTALMCQRVSVSSSVSACLGPISLLPRPHPLINLQLPREGLVTLATKTVASTSQNREVASRLQRANPSRHYCLTYNVTVLIRKFTKAAQVLLLHISLFHSIVACLSSTRMLFVRLQTGENEQTKAYVRATVL